MSCSRIFSLREFALCLVILANAIGLGAVILTTAVSASSTVEKVAAVSSSDTQTLVVERVDQGKVGTDDVHAAVDTTTEIIESLPELSSGKAAVSEQISAQVVEAPATTATAAVAEESSVNLSLVDTTNDSLSQIPGGDMVPAHDAGVAAEEDNLSDPTPVNASTPDSSQLPTTTSPNSIIEPRTLEIAKAMLNADLEELTDSGLDFSTSIEEIDLMAEEERYGEFGKR